MSLQSLIREGNYATAQEAFDAITTPSVVVADSQFYTWAGVAKVAGKDNVNEILTTLKNVDQEAFIYQLGGKGIQLSDPDVQELLLGLAAGGIPGCAALAAKGRSVIAPWQSAGLDEPTIEQVEKAFVVEEARKQMAAILQPVQAKATALNAWLDLLDTSAKTVAEVQAYCDGLLASSDGNP